MKFVKSLWLATLFVLATLFATWLFGYVINYHIPDTFVAPAVVFGLLGVLMGRTVQ